MLHAMGAAAGCSGNGATGAIVGRKGDGRLFTFTYLSHAINLTIAPPSTPAQASRAATPLSCFTRRLLFRTAYAYRIDQAFQTIYLPASHPSAMMPDIVNAADRQGARFPKLR